MGGRLTLSLGLGHQGVSLAGEVVRARNHQYGIRFLDVGIAAAVDATEDLRMILRVLERRWRRERVRAADKLDKVASVLREDPRLSLGMIARRLDVDRHE